MYGGDGNTRIFSLQRVEKRLLKLLVSVLSWKRGKLFD